MNKFRKIWLGFVALMLILFVGYCVFEFLKTDSSGPVISGGEDHLEISIEDGDEVLLAGITATDKKDGDVTDSLIVEKISNFHSDGTRTVTYAAFDSDNHISKMEREISYVDYEGPRFELTGSLRFRAGETPNIDRIVKAHDSLDGDLSNKVKIQMEATLNTRITGFYNVVYQVTNSAGDTAELPINVEIYEPYNYEAELNLDQYLVYYTGESIDYKDYLKSVRRGNLEYAFEGVTLAGEQVAEEPVEPEDNEADAAEGTEDEADVVQQTTTSQKIPKSCVTVDSQVNTSKPGVYPVYFYYTQQIGNSAYEAKEVLYVVVE